MKKSLISLAVTATLGFTAMSATAEELSFDGAWYVIPSVSAMHPDGVLGAEGVGPGVSLRLGKELSEHFDVQIGGGYGYADAKTGSGNYEQGLLGIDALYFFSRDKLRPYVLAGVGGAYNNVDYNSQPGKVAGNHTSWAANVGLGVQYLFTEALGVQAELRHVWSEAVSRNFNTGVSDRDTAGNTYLSLGGVFKFGAPKPVAAAPAPAPAPEPAPLAAPEPAPAPEACKPTIETITIGAEKLFGFNKYNLHADGKQALEDAAAKIKANPAVEMVLVTGHTDRLGSDAYNQKLSERRANAVKDYLVKQGVEAARLQAVGKGESEPVVDCKGVKGHKKLIQCLAPNRRVVLSAKHDQEVGCGK